MASSNGDWTSWLEGYACTACGRLHAPDRAYNLSPCCNAILLARYDLERASKTLDRAGLAARAPGIWRYRELLPVGDPAHVTSLGEGGTPLLAAPRLAREFGLGEVLLKDEGRNPTGTFKDRGASLGVSAVREQGLTKLTLPTSGNAGVAWAAYAARAGIDIHIPMPRQSPAETIARCRLYGARVELVDGTIWEAEALSARAAAQEGRFQVTHFREPYRVEGKKTVALEVAMQRDWTLPDVVVFPTGGGVGPIGFAKGVEELLGLGWANGHVRVIIVQATGCAPLVKAFDANANASEYWPDARTIAKGLATPKTPSDGLILETVRRTGGAAVAVSDEEMLEAMHETARAEGIFACPEAMSAVAALRPLADRGLIEANESVLLVVTGRGKTDVIAGT